MEDWLKIIEDINNLNNIFNISLNDSINNATELHHRADPRCNELNICEYVDNINPQTTNVRNMYNYDIIKENTEEIEKIYKNTENIFSEDIHSENISNKAEYTNFAPDFVDKSENSVENTSYSHQAKDFFHNNYNFKEISNFVDNINTQKSPTVTQSPNININLGGVTQNITEANCDSVLEELGNVLMKALSGCDGIY